jgi:hypothetical protein
MKTETNPCDFTESTAKYPNPMLIGEKYLKEAIREKLTGIVAAYDPDTQCGGIIYSNVEPLRWCLYLPVSENDFANILNQVVGMATPVIKNHIN